MSDVVIKGPTYVELRDEVERLRQENERLTGERDRARTTALQVARDWQAEVAVLVTALRAIRDHEIRGKVPDPAALTAIARKALAEYGAAHAPESVT